VDDFTCPSFKLSVFWVSPVGIPKTPRIWVRPYPKLDDIIAELPRAEGARAEPHSLEILVNPSSRENLVMTSQYERASERRPYRLWGRGRGASRQRKVGNRGMPSFFGGIFKEKKTHFYLSCQQMIAELDLTF